MRPAVGLTVLSLLLALIPVAAGAASPGTERPKLSVIVHVEEGAAVAEAVLNGGIALAKEIWRPYVELSVGREGDALPIGIDQLTLVLTGRLSNEGTGLGWIEFVDGAPAPTITISTRAVVRLMSESTWAGRRLSGWPPAVRVQFMTRALGRSIAHEMGHYLLRSKTHTERGLMRSQLTADDIMSSGASGHRLDAGQLATLSQRMIELARANREPAKPRS